MRIEFIKSHELRGKKQYVGQKMQVWHTLGCDLISMGVAKEYKGQWPPMKTKIKLSKLT